jgi:hypothetical protein
LTGDEKVRPIADHANGTVEFSSKGAYVDTIGINIELVPLLKLFSVLLLQGCPKTLVISCNDRVDRMMIIMSHLFIRRFYVVMLSAKTLHTRIDKKAIRKGIDPAACAKILPTSDIVRDVLDDGMDEIYDLSMYKKVRAMSCGAIPITHEDPVDEIDSFENAINMLFPSGKITLAPWSEFSTNSGGSIGAIRLQICKYIKKFKCEYSGNALSFVDAVD